MRSPALSWATSSRSVEHSGVRVLGVGVVVVKARAVGEDEVALDFLEGERAVLIDLVIGGLVGVLHQLGGAETAGILVRVLEVVIPFHQRAVLGVTADDLDGLVDDIDVSWPSTVMPYSVSMPKMRFIGRESDVRCEHFH